MADMRRVPGGQTLEQRLRIGGIAVLGFLGLILVFSSYYTVETEEVAVVTRFGRYVRTEQPGLHFKLPFGMERADRVKVDRVEKEEFGYRTAQAGVRTRYSPVDYAAESLMLTGDLNLAELEWAVQFKIKEPQDYLFNVHDPRTTLRAISESVMRAVAGDRSITEILNVARREIETEAEERLQAILDEYGSGIEIERVELQNVLPPEPVMPAYTDVEAANQEKEETILRAHARANELIPAAQGEALRALREAEGYAIDRINRASGDADRFLKILEEYEKAPEVTRQRLYLEALREVLPGIRRKIVVDEDLSGVLPLLDLDRKEDRP